MKHVLAGAIQGAVAAFAVWAIGAQVRGPLAEESITRDLLTGAAVAGGVWAVQWSARELAGPPQS